MTFYRTLAVVPALALAAAVIIPPAHAFDQEQVGREPTAAEIAADGWIARPMGLVSTVLGAATFVVTLPFSLTSNSTDRAAKTLVAEPFQYTFRRPLGQFDNCQELPESCIHPENPSVSAGEERAGRM